MRATSTICAARVTWNSKSPPATGRAARCAHGDRKGEKPLVEFLGRATFFTELAPRGQRDFESSARRVSVQGVFRRRIPVPRRADSRERHDGQNSTAKVDIVRDFDPRARGWYAADLHHHADQAEAVTPAPDLARSQLAAGLDLLFVSDHDSMANHEALRGIAAARGCAVHRRHRTVPVLGTFQRLAARPRCEAADRHQHGERRADICRSPPGRRECHSGQSPIHPLRLFREPRAGCGPGRLQPRVRSHRDQPIEPEDDSRCSSVGAFWNSGQHFYLSRRQRDA